jgi:hypothetical protein
MPRKLPEEFEGKEIAPLCIAAKLSEANAVESILDKAQIDYTFEVAPFFSPQGIGIREGVLFMVLSGQLNYCRSLLRIAGLSYLIPDEL